MRHTLASLLDTVTATEPKVYVIEAPDPIPRFGSAESCCRQAVGLLFLAPAKNKKRVHLKAFNPQQGEWFMISREAPLPQLVGSVVDDFARALDCAKDHLMFAGPVLLPRD